jgi:hypothetical protein
MTTSCTIPRVTLKPRAEASPDLNLSAGAAAASASAPPDRTDTNEGTAGPQRDAAPPYFALSILHSDNPAGLNGLWRSPHT